ncbi:hypothetical protein M0812_01983 [Anaeramoeba flamelloides]|uniref:Uncharacterized protein n=1 Tax=Anaeramoeba flamelloides TaxID=1746091 RepID=A0AAV7Z5D6_9EUKA|nr:hypothetical protein M0812_01983 [Anaeramoeba flamelloides]
MKSGYRFCGIICFVLFFLLFTPALIWTITDKVYKNKFDTTKCLVEQKAKNTTTFQSHQKGCLGKATQNTISNVTLSYEYNNNQYDHVTQCNLGRICRTSRGDSCANRMCQNALRTSSHCRLQIDLYLNDFFYKYLIGDQYSCYVLKDNPYVVTFSLPIVNWKYTLFLWIPAAVFCLAGCLTLIVGYLISK